MSSELVGSCDAWGACAAAAGPRLSLTPDRRQKTRHGNPGRAHILTMTKTLPDAGPAWKVTFAARQKYCPSTLHGMRRNRSIERNARYPLRRLMSRQASGRCHDAHARSLAQFLCGSSHTATRTADSASAPDKLIISIRNPAGFVAAHVTTSSRNKSVGNRPERKLVFRNTQLTLDTDNDLAAAME